MIIKQLKVGSMKTFCYLVGCEETGEAAVIDPGAEPDKIFKLSNNLSIKYIFNTHFHPDHTNGNARLKKLTNAKILIHKNDVKGLRKIISFVKIGTLNFALSPYPDIIIDEETIIKVGKLQFETINTPGHSPGGICFYSDGKLFTGDTLFVGRCGRTDLPGGDRGTLGASLRKLISKYPDNTIIMPGHDYGPTPTSTIGWEKRNNINAEEYGFKI